jgi:hypothetical protein
MTVDDIAQGIGDSASPSAPNDLPLQSSIRTSLDVMLMLFRQLEHVIRLGAESPIPRNTVRDRGNKPVPFNTVFPCQLELFWKRWLLVR